MGAWRKAHNLTHDMRRHLEDFLEEVTSKLKPGYLLRLLSRWRREAREGVPRQRELSRQKQGGEKNKDSGARRKECRMHEGERRIRVWEAGGATAWVLFARRGSFRALGATSGPQVGEAMWFLF